MDAYNRWWQGLAGNKPTDWNQALQMMGEGPGGIQSPVNGGVMSSMGALQLEDFPTRNPVADNISMGPEDPGQGGMTMPTGASGYGTMSSQMGYEGMPAPQMGGDGVWPQMQATHTQPIPGSGGSRYPMDLSGSPGIISGQGPVGGMSMPQGASGYGTMSSQMGESGAAYPMGIGRHLSAGGGAEPPMTPEEEWFQYNVNKAQQAGVNPADYGFGPLDALKRRSEERATASQRFQGAAQKLNR